MVAPAPNPDSAGPLHRSFRLPRWGLCLLATTPLIVVALIAVDILERRRLRLTEFRGDQVVKAVERFRADKRRYPDSLEELAPKYMLEILQPAWGLKQWRYTAKSDTFSLSVDESPKSGDGDAHRLEYSVRNQSWQLAD